jgi:hypothetical protein
VNALAWHFALMCSVCVCVLPAWWCASKQKVLPRPINKMLGERGRWMQRRREKSDCRPPACAPNKKMCTAAKQSRAARARVCITTEIILIGGGQMFLRECMYVIFIFIASLSAKESAHTTHIRTQRRGEGGKLRHSQDSWNRSLALLLPTQVIYVKLFPVALLHGTPFPLGRFNSFSTLLGLFATFKY